MSEQAGKTSFSGSPVVVGVMPDQDPSVWTKALDLAQSLNAPLIAAFVDPASYLIEWTPGSDVLPISLNPVVEPEDETSLAAEELKETLTAGAVNHTTQWTLRIVGGDPALAIGRLAAAVGASTIVVGARRPGFIAKVDELVSGSMLHRLLVTQTVPVLGIPSHAVQRHFHSHG